MVTLAHESQSQNGESSDNGFCHVCCRSRKSIEARQCPHCLLNFHRSCVSFLRDRPERSESDRDREAVNAICLIERDDFPKVMQDASFCELCSSYLDVILENDARDAAVVDDEVDEHNDA